MDLVTWDKSYSVNVESCDAEHRRLFSLLNDLHNAMKAGQSSTVIAGTVHQLEKYTQTHFLAEEARMQSAQYAKLPEHRMEHQKFVAKVKQFRSDLEAGRKCDAVAVVTFVKDWLSKHIMQTDKMYSKDMNSHGIK